MLTPWIGVFLTSLCYLFFLHAQKSQQKGACVAFVCRCVEKQFSLLNLSHMANKD